MEVIMLNYLWEKIGSVFSTKAQLHAGLSNVGPVVIEAPVDTTDPTDPITTLSCQIGRYYRIDVPVETLAITLPAVADATTVKTVVIYLTGGTTPAVTFSSTAPSGGTAPDIGDGVVDGVRLIRRDGRRQIHSGDHQVGEPRERDGDGR